MRWPLLSITFLGLAAILTPANLQAQQHDVPEQGDERDQTVARPPWLRFPPAGLLSFSLQGRFPDADPFQMKWSYTTEEWSQGRRLASDDGFLVKHSRGDYTFWAALLELEKRFPADEVPQFPIRETRTLEEYAKEYGKPSSTGRFRTADDNMFVVHWYGPVLLMASAADRQCMAVGGWPSRLLQQPKPSVSQLAAHFTTNAKWPILNGDSGGEMEVRVTNPNECFVRVALRAGDKGKDFLVGPNEIQFVRVGKGSYDVYFQYSSDVHSLHKGDSCNVEDRGVAIKLVKIVCGNYGIRKIE